jgi:hypothetical protein
VILFRPAVEASRNSAEVQTGFTSDIDFARTVLEEAYEALSILKL